jgi:glycosyltransferase involved in cell wall biosynthesis
MKLAVLTNILTPYRIPLFAAMGARVEGLRVFVMAKREENRDWELPQIPFDWQVLPGWHVRLPGAPVSVHLNRGVGRALRRFDPDVVLSGGFAPANLAAWLYCGKRRRAFVNWGELSAIDLTMVSAPKRALRRVMIAGGDAAIASSSEARRVFLHYGARSESVLTAVMPIDVELFHNRARSYRQTQAFAVERARFPGAVLLSIGRLVDSKGWPELLAMYAEILRRRPDTSLLIVGDGPQRAAYEAAVRARGWRNVRFTGFQQSDEVARYLALADVFVFPTLADPFGAVLGEAMAAELAVVASIHAAATLDLVEDGRTGWRIDPRDIGASAATIERVLEMSAEQRRALGTRAYLQVKKFDIVPTAAAMVDFMRGAASARSAAGRGVLS